MRYSILQKLKTLSAMIVMSAVVSSAHAATFTWSGGTGTGSNWYDTGNWVGASVPSQGTRLGTEGEVDVVVLNSETAISSYMPTDTITVDSDWFGSGADDHLFPAVQVLNGTINLAGPGGEWWHYAGGNIFQIGDGDMTTAAQVNSSFTNWTRHMDRGGKNLITINADGTFNQTANFRFSTGGGNDAQLTLNGGTFISSGTVTDLVTGDLDDFVSFTAPGSSFTAPLGGGDFITLTDVTDAFGTHFLDTTGSGLAAVDNTDGSFTVSVVPEPSSAALLGLGGLILILRRRV